MIFPYNSLYYTPRILSLRSLWSFRFILVLCFRQIVSANYAIFFFFSSHPRAFCTLPSFAPIKRPRWRHVESTSTISRKKIGDYKQSTCGQTFSGIPGSGITSDWSVLTDYVNTRALLTQMRYAIWRRLETFERLTRCHKSVKNSTLKDFPQVDCLREEQTDCLKKYGQRK